MTDDAQVRAAFDSSQRIEPRAEFRRALLDRIEAGSLTAPTRSPSARSRRILLAASLSVVSIAVVVAVVSARDRAQRVQVASNREAAAASLAHDLVTEMQLPASATAFDGTLPKELAQPRGKPHA